MLIVVSLLMLSVPTESEAGRRNGRFRQRARFQSQGYQQNVQPQQGYRGSSTCTCVNCACNPSSIPLIQQMAPVPPPLAASPPPE